MFIGIVLILMQLMSLGLQLFQVDIDLKMEIFLVLDNRVNGGVPVPIWQDLMLMPIPEVSVILGDILAGMLMNDIQVIPFVVSGIREKYRV